MKRLLTVTVMSAALAGFADTLTWNGGTTGVWDATTQNWLNGNNEVCAWTDGSVAAFPAGVSVDVQDAFEATGLVFAGDATLAGIGFINLADASPITIAGGATVGLSVNTHGSVAVDGAGTLYANALHGTAAVSNGALMIGGLHMADRLAATATGNGTVTWLAGDAAGSNLITNGSFEEGASTGSYTYLSGDKMPTAWVRTDTASMFVLINSTGMTTWSNHGIGGTTDIPDGKYAVGLQRYGYAEQELTVANAGFYDFSMVMFKRTNYGAEINDHRVKVSIDGVQQVSFFDPYRSGTWRTVNSGPIYLSAGTHTLRLEGAGRWGDVTSFIDNLKLLPCVASAKPAPLNESAFGNGLTGLNSVDSLAPDDGGISYFTKLLGGDYAMMPTFGSNVMVTVESGKLDFSGITLSEPAKLHKFGRGSLHLKDGMAPIHTMALWQGELIITTDDTISFCAHTFDFPVRLTMDMTGDINMNDSPEFFGNAPVTITTTGNGHIWTLNGNFRTTVPMATFDIGAGDTVSVNSIIQYNDGGQTFPTDLVKTGSGTLYIRASDATTIGGTVFLRDGTLELCANDLANGSVHPITGASAGQPALGNALANALQIADAATPSDAAIALKLNGTNLATARTLNIGNGGGSVVLATSGNRQGFFGNIKLARSVTLVTSPADAKVELGVIARADDYAGTVTLDGTGAGILVLNGVSGAGVTVISDKGVDLGTGYQLGVAMDALTLSGETSVSFGPSGYDTFNVGTLTLGTLTVSLVNDITGGVFAEVGSYTLFSYDTFNGDLANLSVAADSQIEGFAYTFRDTGSAIVLDIAATEGAAYYNWITQSGTWASAASWSPSLVPNEAGLTVRFGASATEAATVTLADTYGLTTLQFANDNGYTLTGGKLQFGTDGENAPSISAEYGTHTIQSEITSTDNAKVNVNIESGAKVVFDGPISAPVDVNSGKTSLGTSAAVNAPLTIGDSATLAVDSDSTLGGTGNVTINGSLSGSGKLTKTGDSTLSLNNNAASTFNGTLAATSGTIQSGYPAFSGTTELESGASLTSDATIHGLRGTFYQVASTPPVCWYATSLEAFKAAVNGKTMIAQEIIVGGSDGFDIADSNTTPTTLPTILRNNSGDSRRDYWLGVFEGVMTVPTAGLYRFQAQVDDGMVWAIDGKQFITITNVNTTANSIYLEKGPHSMYIGVTEISGNAYAHITMLAPGETTGSMIPNEWLTPYGTGITQVHGNGKLAPANSSALYVESSRTGYNTAFTGTLAGGDTGTLFVGIAGGGDFSVSSYLKGYMYSHLGEVTLVASGADVEAFASDNTGTTGLTGAKSVRALYGNNGKLALGAHLFNRGITSDEDCGISPYKTYTHLLKFPITKSAVVNGVAFNQTGMDSYSISPMLPSSHDGVAGTGVRSLFAGFHYNQQTFEITLSGLIPGAVYEFRNYHFAWNTDTSTSAKKRPVTFSFIVDGRTVDSYTCNLDTAYGYRADNAIGVLGCRYQAGSDGKVTVRYHAGYNSDTTHLYAISNEQINPTPAEDAITLSPGAGERATFSGQLVGSNKVTIDTDGEQAFAGSVSLLDPIEVARGRLILQRGATVAKGVNIGDNGILDMRGGATVNALTGSGAVVLPFGDADIYGSVQDDGTFAEQESWRLVKFTGDADSGLSPSKNYKAVFSFDNVLNFLNPPIVNEVCFLTANSGTCRFNNTGLYASNLPSSAHGANANTGVSSDQAIYEVLRRMCYSQNNGGKTMEVLLDGLTSGTTYEIRFYSRQYSSGTRNVTISFDPNGSDTPTESHTVNIDDAANHPCYFGFRFKAAGTTYKFTHLSPDNGNTWHMYGMSLEAVEDAGNVRTFNITTDQSYDGTISGIGIVNKTGAGKLTLNGQVSATGFWTVSNGGLALANPDSTLFKLSVKEGATFGGMGTITGTAGFASGSTLELGVPGVPGTLTLAASDNVFANGTNLRVNHTANETSTLTVGDIALPDQLAVTMVPDTAGVKLFGNRVLIQSANGFYNPPDLSNWTVVDETGEAINGMEIRYSDDAKAILISGTSGTLIILQ
ncbi:MAG: hypothetical protein IJU44_11480 [Kiritimatiellae bacterium]|nr:hypothetical protein [Kiritimatiellia bacterium]